jgi:subtilisin family serine protease
MSKRRSRRSISQAAHRAVFTPELLEARKLLAMVPAGELFVNEDGVRAVRLEWNGEQVEMLAGRWIVQMDGFSGYLMNQQQQMSERLAAQAPEFSVRRHMGADGLFLVDAPLTLTPAQLLQRLSQVDGFQFAEPDFLYHIQLTPNDPDYGVLWGMHNTGQSSGTVDADIDAPEAWDMTTGHSSVVIGVVDTGLDYNHPDLINNRWTNPYEIPGNNIDDEGNGYVDDIRGYDWWGNSTSDGPGDNDPVDQNNHGTHVSGTIAGQGNNATGVVGVNWAAQIMALKIGGPGSSVSGADAISAMNYVLDMKNRGVNINVTNHSWGGGGFSAAMNTAIANHAAAGLITVCAAGNNGANNDVSAFYPATYPQPNIISVGNHTRNNARNSGSNYGQTTVHLFAPGTDIRSTIRTAAGSYSNFTGTSMASPHVAGAAALGFNVVGATTGGYATVRNAILNNVTSVASMATQCITGGRLDANLMLESLIFVQTGSTLTVNGTLSNDTITIAFSGGNISATVGSRTKTYPLAQATTININSGDGNDNIVIDSTGASGTININAGNGTDTITVNGTSGAIVAIKPSAGADNVNINTDNTGTASALFDDTQTLGSLSIGAGGTGTLKAGSSRWLRVSSLSINSAGKLDLNDNDMIVDYSGVSPFTTIRNQVFTARNGGNWLGNGITSTNARTHPQQITTLGVLESADYFSAGGTTFNGQTVDATTVLVKYTYYGDSDLNGSVDFDDYARIDGGFLGGGNKWFAGDYNHDGVIDFDDFALIDSAFLLQGPVL